MEFNTGRSWWSWILRPYQPPWDDPRSVCAACVWLFVRSTHQVNIDSTNYNCIFLWLWTPPINYDDYYCLLNLLHTWCWNWNPKQEREMSSAKPITKKGLEWLPVFFFFSFKRTKNMMRMIMLFCSQQPSSKSILLLLDAQCRCRGLKLRMDIHFSWLWKGT